MYITKETKWHPSCRRHDNSFAPGPVLIKTNITRFYLKQGQEPITWGVQLPYLAYVTAFLQTDPFLGFSSREIGHFRSTSARIGKCTMAAPGGHADIIKYAECANSLPIFLFHSLLSSRSVFHNPLPYVLHFQLAKGKNYRS